MSKIRVCLDGLTATQANHLGDLAGQRPFIPQRWEDCPPGYIPGQFVWPRHLEIDEAWRFAIEPASAIVTS